MNELAFFYFGLTSGLFALAAYVGDQAAGRQKLPHEGRMAFKTRIDTGPVMALAKTKSRRAWMRSPGVASEWSLWAARIFSLMVIGMSALAAGGGCFQDGKGALRG
jgi:hypothetical protein